MVVTKRIQSSMSPEGFLEEVIPELKAKGQGASQRARWGAFQEQGGADGAEETGLQGLH